MTRYSLFHFSPYFSPYNTTQYIFSLSHQITQHTQYFLSLFLRSCCGSNDLDSAGCGVHHTGTVRYSTVQCSIVQYSTVQYSTVRYSIVQYSTVQYSTVQYGTVQCNIVQYSTVQYGTVQYSIVRYRTEQYSTSHCSTLQYVIIQHTQKTRTKLCIHFSSLFFLFSSFQECL